jgi:hypothetical protein
MPVIPKASYKKVKRKALLYDLDLLNQQVLFRVDLIIESVDTVTTPVTPLYQARFTDDNPNALPARGFDPRQLTCCFELDTKVVNRTVFNPYRPSTPENKGLIRELINLPEVKALTYTGESHERNYERFV